MRKLLFFSTLIIFFCLSYSLVYSRPIEGTMDITNISFLIKGDEEVFTFLIGNIHGDFDGKVNISFNVSSETYYFIVPDIVVIPTVCQNFQECDEYYSGHIENFYFFWYHYDGLFSTSNKVTTLFEKYTSSSESDSTDSYPVPFIYGEFQMEDKEERFALGYLELKSYETTDGGLTVYDGTDYIILNMTINGVYKGFLNENRVVIDEHEERISVLESWAETINATLVIIQDFVSEILGRLTNVEDAVCTVHPLEGFPFCLPVTTTIPPTTTTTTIPETTTTVITTTTIISECCGLLDEDSEVTCPIECIGKIENCRADKYNRHDRFLTSYDLYPGESKKVNANEGYYLKLYGICEEEVPI